MLVGNGQPLLSTLRSLSFNKEEDSIDRGKDRDEEIGCGLFVYSAVKGMVLSWVRKEVNDLSDYPPIEHIVSMLKEWVVYLLEINTSHDTKPFSIFFCFFCSYIFVLILFLFRFDPSKIATREDWHHTKRAHNSIKRAHGHILCHISGDFVRQILTKKETGIQSQNTFKKILPRDRWGNGAAPIVSTLLSRSEEKIGGKV